MTKKIQEIKSEPTFIEQAFAIIEETYSIPGAEKEHGMKIADHKLLCRVLNAHEDYIDKKIIEKFVKEIADHYKPITDTIAKFEVYKSRTIYRNILTAAFAIVVSIILFFQIMNNRLDRIEKRLEEHINKVEQVR
jgi:3-methyladenine DNA glycosylase/8-oxoguanine DNA glycosylase